METKPKTNKKNGAKSTHKGRPKSELTDIASHSGVNYWLTLIFIISIFLIYDVVYSSVSNQIDIEALEDDLKTNVNYQTQPIDVIIKTLNNSDEKLKLLTFIGPTGVGKTHTANIIKKHFNGEIFEASSGSMDVNLINQIKNNGLGNANLVIVDNLAISDVENIIKFLQDLPQDVFILVVSIFNIQETDSKLNRVNNYEHIDMIEQKLSQTGISGKTAIFNELDSNQASDWITKQLTKRNVEPRLHVSILNSLLTAHNVKHFGLKGLNSKMNLLL